MSASFTPSGQKTIVAVTTLGVAALILVRFFGPAARQARNLDAAREHASRLEPEIHREARFREVRLGEYTGDGGCLSVSGIVGSDRDSNDLRALIEASHSPVPAHYRITVLPVVDLTAPK
jgi:hypothetical protein